MYFHMRLSLANLLEIYFHKDAKKTKYLVFFLSFHEEGFHGANDHVADSKPLEDPRNPQGSQVVVSSQAVNDKAQEEEDAGPLANAPADGRARNGVPKLGTSGDCSRNAHNPHEPWKYLVEIQWLN